MKTQTIILYLGDMHNNTYIVPQRFLANSVPVTSSTIEQHGSTKMVSHCALRSRW